MLVAFFNVVKVESVPLNFSDLLPQSAESTALLEHRW